MQAWDEFLQTQEQEMGANVVQQWLRTLNVVHFDAQNLYLEANDSFHANWFEEQMRAKVRAHLFNSNRRPIRVHVSVSTLEPLPPKSQTSQKTPLPPFELAFDQLDPWCTFETFVESDGNRLASSLLRDLSDEFNPLFLYGPEGVGKTHLLMATAHALRAQGKYALYVRAETFTAHVIGAIRAGAMDHFRQSYRKVDALLIDNTQKFTNKKATQEELFHTFNTLHLDKCPLIFAADCSPQELKAVEPRLVSRFEWGLVAPMEVAPDSKAILEAKSRAMDFPLDPKVIDFLCDKFVSSPKALIQALEALVLRTDSRVGRLHAESLLNDLIGSEERGKITPERVVSAVSSYYGIKTDDIMGKSQKREASLPRQVSMFLCRNHLQLPYTQIGELFERNHSTVMTSVNTIKKELAKNGELPRILNAILKDL